MSKIYTIGRRNSKKADILIDNKTVSSIHAKVWFDDYSQNFWIEDVQSTNHTYIIREGQKTMVNSPCKVFPSDIIVLGEKKIVFSYFLQSINGHKKEKNEDRIKGMCIERCRTCGSPKKIGQICDKC